MSEPVTLTEIKVHLRLNPGATGEDAALAAMLIAARSLCEAFTGRTIVGDKAETDPNVLAIFIHAIKVLCAAWYEDRAGEYATPPAAAALLRTVRVMGAPQ